MSSLIETWKREIDVQQPRNAELLTSHIDNLVFLFGTGMTYYFVLNFWKFELEYVSSNIAEHLDVSSGDIRIEELLTVLHPSDQVSISKKEEIVLQFFAEIPVENYGDYKPSYFLRVRLKDGSYRTVLHQSSVLSISNDDKVEQVLTVHTDVTHLNLPYNNDVVILKKGSLDVARYSPSDTGEYELSTATNVVNFTKREIETLRLLSQGFTWKEIANKLHISPHTIHTHKRNMMAKTGCKNTAHLVSEAILGGVL